MKKSLLFSLSLLALTIFTGCNFGTSSGSSEYMLSGKVIDSVTGSGVAGAKVGFGENIMTTDASGNYSVTVNANEAITGNFYVSKGTDYEFSVYSGINLTPVSNLTYNIKIYPVDTSSYTTHTISGYIYQDDGHTEIANSSDIYITIFNEDGGSDEWYATYVKGTGYSIDTKTFGSSCVLFIEVGDSTPFFYYIDNVDLSGSDVSLDLIKPSTGYSTVTVTGIADSYFGGAMVYSDSILLQQGSGSLSGTTTTADVQIYNPDNKSFSWTTEVDQENTPANGDSTVSSATSSASVPGTEVTLPVPTLSGSTEAVLGSSISYSAGTLSFTGSADLYSISLEPNEDGAYGYIMSPTISVDLPTDIVTIITSGSDSYTSWDAYIESINTSSSFNLDLFLSTQSSDGFIPGIEFVMIQGAAPESVDLIP